MARATPARLPVSASLGAERQNVSSAAGRDCLRILLRRHRRLAGAWSTGRPPAPGGVLNLDSAGFSTMITNLLFTYFFLPPLLPTSS